MVCGGFSCSKNALIILNVLYIVVSIILVAIAAYCRVAAIVVSLSLVGGVIACGVFLFFIALIGLIGACKHHQVLLFFYMIVLFVLFLIQFSLGCACLAVNKEQELSIVKQAWYHMDNELKSQVQYKLDCCGFESYSLNYTEKMGHPSCEALPCCKANPEALCCKAEREPTEVADESCPCDTCLKIVEPKVHDSFTLTGGIGLFFSFTEILGVWLALRYRNLKDPEANPNAFL